MQSSESHQAVLQGLRTTPKWPCLYLPNLIVLTVKADFEISKTVYKYFALFDCPNCKGRDTHAGALTLHVDVD